MTTYYVDKAAADGGDGSEAAPWNTIAAAVAVATIGDTVRVAAGTYTGTGSERFNSGSNRDVTWYAHGGRVTVDGTGQGNVSCFGPATGADQVLDGDADSMWYFTGFLGASSYGIITTGTAGLIIRGCPVVVYNCTNGFRPSGTGTYSIERLRCIRTTSLSGIFDGAGASTIRCYYCEFGNGTRVEISNSNAATVIEFYNPLFRGLSAKALRLTSACRATVNVWNYVVAGCVNPNVTDEVFDNEAGVNAVLNIGKGYLLSKPTDYTKTTVDTTDLGGNVVGEPVFKAGLRNGSISLNVDDSVNIATFRVMRDHGDANGYKVSHALDLTTAQSAADWAEWRAAVNDGHDLLVHTRHACNMSTLLAMGLQYVGNATTATAAISGGVMTLTLAGDQTDGSTGHALTLADYDTAIDLVTAIDAFTGWNAITYNDVEAVVGTGVAYGVSTGNTNTRQYTGNGIATNLDDLTATDCKTAQVNLTYDRALHFQEEVAGCIADILANTGYTVTGLVYPGAWRDSTYDGDIQSSGITAARVGQNTTGAKWYLDDYVPMASEAWHAVTQWPTTLTAAQLRQSVMAYCEWVKLTGACVQLYAHGLGGSNYTQAQLEDVLDLIVESGVTVKTYTQQIADMRAGMAYNDLEWVPEYLGAYAGIETGVPNRGARLDLADQRPKNPPTIGPVESRPGIRPAALLRPASL